MYLPHHTLPEQINTTRGAVPHGFSLVPVRSISQGYSQITVRRDREYQRGTTGRGDFPFLFSRKGRSYVATAFVPLVSIFSLGVIVSSHILKPLFLCVLSRPRMGVSIAIVRRNETKRKNSDARDEGDSSLDLQLRFMRYHEGCSYKYIVITNYNYNTIGCVRLCCQRLLLISL